MRIPLRIALAFGMAGVLAACTDESKAPTGPVVPGAISSAKSALNIPATCDAGALKTYARNYASKPNDQLLSLIADLPATFKADGNTVGATTTDKAFDALSRIGFIRGTSLMKPDAGKANFDLLVRGLLGCTASAVTAGMDEQLDFSGALLKGWVFEVRGKDAGTEVGGAFERGYTDSWWAAQPDTGGWATAITSTLKDAAGTLLTPRVLIYGKRTSTSATPGRLGSTFEHFSIPRMNVTRPAGQSFDVTATLGLCFASLTQITGTPYLNHDKKFLARENPIFDPQQTFCDDPATFTETSAVAFGGRLNPLYLARQAARHIWPQPLYAAMFFGGGSVTGTPDDWSPSAVWDLSQFVLPTGPLAMGNGKTTEEIHPLGGGSVQFAVSIPNTDSTPPNPPSPLLLPAPDGTPVTVSVVGNSSVIAYFSDGSSTGPTATRYVKDGMVSFDGVKLIKAGGYQLAFQVAFEGFGGTQLLTTSFNIQNK